MPGFDDLPEAKQEKLIDACKDLARIIKDAEIPEGMVRRCLSFELAEFVYNDHQFWR